MPSQKLTYTPLFLPSENKLSPFIFHNYHFKANLPRPHSTLTPIRGVKDNYCQHHIKLQLLVCLFVSLCDLKTAIFYPGKVPSLLLSSLLPTLTGLHTLTRINPSAEKRKDRQPAA